MIPARKITPAQGERLLLCLVLPRSAPDELQGARSFFGMSVTAQGDEIDPVPEPAPSGDPGPGPGGDGSDGGSPDEDGSEGSDPGETGGDGSGGRGGGTGPGGDSPAGDGSGGGSPGGDGGGGGGSTPGSGPGSNGGGGGGTPGSGSNAGDGSGGAGSGGATSTAGAGFLETVLASPLPQRLARTGLDALPALALAAAAVAGGLLLSRLARTVTRRRTS
ncbi:hypothetical protein [uncultured Pseudokineococcus sp.]|uniref:hypothetical protein n=1 Tax=uncultured Pseudokineococcus sp. TaxID=1642928 RepID=UPI00260DA3A1|nr:hypothetical protein [uncultured Pseudokineococcus sp.]